MKNLISFLILFLSFSQWVSGQDKYTGGMQKAFGLMEEEKFAEAIAMFERIGQAEPDQWVPLYHAANLLIGASFEEKDKATQEQFLEKAKDLIMQAHERSGQNAELLTLEGMLWTGFLNMDPMTNGAILTPKIVGLHRRALAIDPDNPRARLNDIEFNMGKDRFFGNDLSVYCDQFREILPKFEQQEAGEPFAPSHGKERAEYHLKNCDE